VVDILSERGEFLGRGFYEPDSTIAFRMLSNLDEEIDDGFFGNRVENAWSLRRSLFDPSITNAFRLVNGEGDLLPGLNIDIYGDYSLLQSYSYGIMRFISPIASALGEALPNIRGIYHKARVARSKMYPSATKEDGPTEHIWGEEAPSGLEVSENGLRFAVSLKDGAKTGLYLDMRSNREIVEKLSRGLGEVLNVFSYTGSFSLYALRGGAGRVANVDLSKKANERAKGNFALNGYDEKKHEFFTDQADSMLERFKRRGRSFDLIILDPPTFSTSPSGAFSLAQGYGRLAHLTFDVLNRGGLLAAAANSRQVDLRWLTDTLNMAAASAGRSLQVVNVGSLPPDFPTLPSLPDERYLKFTVVRAI